jgi:arylsulfatase A-like enzyme
MKKSGWTVFTLLLFANVGVLTGRAVSLAQVSKRPNVLLITTDQQRVDAASAVGNPWLKTPHLDALAAHGVYFTKSYCSYPLCSPSRGSLHTGRFPHEIGVDHNNMSIAASVKISGELFQEAGYETAYVGKWHLPEVYPAEGIRGFKSLNAITRRGKLARDVDEATMQAAIEFIKQRRDKPFYLVVSFINPHDICLLAGEDSPLFDQVWHKYGPAAGIELPPLPASFMLPEKEPQWLVNRRPKHAHWDENHWRRYIYAYYRMVEDVDQQIGGVLNALRETGQEEETLVVFTSDHGEGLGCHRWTGKMMFFDPEAAVPLIISWKGKTPAGRIDREHLVSTVDVLPTICDYAGIEPPREVRGQSLRPIIENPTAPWRNYVVCEIAHTPALGRSFMVRSDRYKYMVLPGGSGEPVEMLFDLETDPDELRNLATEPKYLDVLKQHREWLAEWKQITEEAKYPILRAPSQPRPRKQQAKAR